MKDGMLKIRDARVSRFKMERRDPAWRTATYASNEVDGFILELVTDRAVGIGATAAHPNSIAADILAAQLRALAADVLKGAGALAGNAIRLAVATANVHPRAHLAVDLAIYDLAGKLADLPCHALWGGAVRSELKVVRMIGIKPPAELVNAVRALLDQGYAHFKVKIGTGLKEDLDRIRAIRDAFGNEVWIAVDGNSAYTPTQAIELSRALEPYRVSLIEQPVDYEDVEGLARVTRASAIPVMADQCVRDVRSALAVCQSKAAHVVSIKGTSLGSLDECRRIYGICRAFGVRVHIGGSVTSALADIAQACLAATLPEVDEECEVGEFMAVSGDPVTGVTIRDGRIQLNSEPGWGVGIEPEFCERHALK